MIDDFAKSYLHDNMRWAREEMLWKLDGLSEYDVRRPLTLTGTNLLGLVKHLAVTNFRYFGDVFERPVPDSIPPVDDTSESDMWATADETREAIIKSYKRAWAVADTTIEELPLDGTGYVCWWPRPEVKLFNIMVHVLTETNRHLGHADILREQLDGVVGDVNGALLRNRSEYFWASRYAQVEQAAHEVDQAQT